MYGCCAGAVLMLAVNSVIDHIHQLLIIHNSLVFFYQLFVCFILRFAMSPHLPYIFVFAF